MSPINNQKSPVGRQMLWLVSALALCVIAPMLLHAATGGSSNARNPWWCLVIIVLSGASYSGVIASHRRQLFGMVLWLFTYIFMGLAPYVQYRLDSLPTTVHRTDESYFPAAGLLIICSILAVMIGATAGRTQGDVYIVQSKVIDTRRANMLTVTAFLIFVYYGQAVGFSSFVLSRTDFSAVRAQVWSNSAVSALLTGGLHMTLLVAFIAQMACREQEKLEHKKARWILPLLNGLVLLYTVNPIGSSRTLVGTVLLAVLATFGAFSTVLRFRVMAILSLAGMLLLFPAASLFRHSTSATLDLEGPVTSLTSGDFDAFGQLATSIDYVAHEGLTYGNQLLGVLLFWVPRSLWPNKPVDTGVLLGEYMQYGFTNLSAPIWAELFVNFGWIGVLVGMGLLGYWFRRWDYRTDLYLAKSRIPPVAVCAVVFYLLIVLRGSLLNATSYLLVIILATVFVSKGQPRTAALSGYMKSMKERQVSK